MTFLVRTVQLTAAAAVALAIQPAAAQTPVLLGPGVQIEYKEPTNPAHKPIYDRLKAREVLEQYRTFMSPLRMRRSLTVILQGCDGVINAWYSNGRITHCYELIANLNRLIVETNVLPGFRREDAVVGGFVSTILHETGHAIFDLLDVPIFGREEDAADAIASFVALQFGPSTARRILTGTAFVWRAEELAHSQKARRFEDYGDEHGTEAQRFYNTLCIALGSDVVEKTRTFADFVALLGERRRGHCPREYMHAKKSFERLVLPHVDLPLMKKVRATEWLRSDDGIDLAPPGPITPNASPGGSSGPGGPGTPR